MLWDPAQEAEATSICAWCFLHSGASDPHLGLLSASLQSYLTWITFLPEHSPGLLGSPPTTKQTGFSPGDTELSWDYSGSSGRSWCYGNYTCQHNNWVQLCFCSINKLKDRFLCKSILKVLFINSITA